MSGTENPSHSTPKLPSRSSVHDFLEESGYATARQSTESDLIDWDIRKLKEQLEAIRNIQEVAVELDTYNRAEKQHIDGRSYLRQTSQTDERESHIDRNENYDHTALFQLMSKMERQLQELQNDVRELKKDKNSRQTEKPRAQNYNGPGRFNKGEFRQRGGRYNSN
ncbi:unnamed protein product [Mytilus coruscus]|uniref:Uncharacterized protein n=1 Tax=Mytilus coruscus TaxID=42192 RepID=A0A6J8A443_MYTCO|nr:unnamed protein product [Mytilus coruscus]